MTKYIPRILDEKIKLALSSMGAVLIEGPKWCGKTTTGVHHAKSVIKMQDPTNKEQNMMLSKISPLTLLNGEKPRLIDEWQMAPNLWDAVRSDVDESGLKGQYILTGSSSPVIGATMHTGTGRIARLTMYPMTLYESGISSGGISLSQLFDGENIQIIKSELTLENYVELICKGGWPHLIDTPIKESLFTMNQYVEAIINNDIQDIGDAKTDPVRLAGFLKSYSRNLHTLATNKTLENDVIQNDSTISARTIYNYLDKLHRLFIIDEIQAWAPNIRSRTGIRTQHKRSFVDPSIAVAILGLNPSSLLGDLRTLGFFFENLCIRDLKVYADSINGKLFHYRDRLGLECDAIIRLNDGRYGLVEVKLSDALIDEAAENLLKLRDLLKENLSEPSFLMVITGSSLAYTRDDGIHVVPLGLLKD